MKIDKETRDNLIELWNTKKVSLEGNILKVLDADGDEEFESYIKDSLEKDKDTRRKRLEVTRKVQSQNIELVKWKEENEKIQINLKESLEKTECLMREAERAKEEAEEAREQALKAKADAEMSSELALIAKADAEMSREQAVKAKVEAENAKASAENDLDIMQKKSQFELIGTIVKVALWVILGVGLLTTGVFVLALFTGKDTAIIGSTWSNIIGILLTNAFSIIGTIMGVKYASDKHD